MDTQNAVVRRAWLMWVGEAHYKTFDDFAAEAMSQGVSKRVPNVMIARELLSPGSVVFLAHDDGVKDPCPECMETFACPDCTRVAGAPTGQILRGRGSKRRAVDCRRCGGDGQVTEGTGGAVYVNRRRMTFKSYVGKLRHGLVSDGDRVRVVMQCEACSATGSTPRGRIRGLFVPQGSEYILRTGDRAIAIGKLVEAGIGIVSPGALLREPERECGRRQRGGFYVVTQPGGSARRSRAVVDELVARGIVKPGAVEVHGAFASFVRPVPTAAKRFRGIKEIALPAGAKVQAKHILQAMA